MQNITGCKQVGNTNQSNLIDIYIYNVNKIGGEKSLKTASPELCREERR